jgi:nitrous oxide reductase accessory protein NosL
MRILLTIAMVMAVGLLALSAAKERPRCDNCGMYTDVSATRVEAVLKYKGKDHDHNFVCLHCIKEYNEKKYEGKAELKSFKILDYTTFETKTPKMIDGMAAYYLYGTKSLKGSMMPWIAAFADKAAATKAKSNLGGEVMNFKDMWAKLNAADSKMTAGAEYRCEMCNYSSSKAGNCPHCGMKLEKKTK